MTTTLVRPKPTTRSETPRTGLPIKKGGELTLPQATLLFGDSGVGKTRLILTALAKSDKHNLLFVTDDAAELEVGKKMLAKGEIARLPDAVLIESWDTAIRLPTMLRNLRDYDIIALDSATRLQRRDKDNIAAKQVTRDVPQATDSDVLAGDRELHPAHWGKLLDSFDKFLTLLKEQGIALIITALADRDENPLDGEVIDGIFRGTLQIIPDFEGAMKRQILAAFSVGAYMFIGPQGQYCLTTQQVSHIRTKDRTILREHGVFVNPSYDIIEAAFAGESLPSPTEEERRMTDYVKRIKVKPLPKMEFGRR